MDAVTQEGICFIILVAISISGETVGRLQDLILTREDSANKISVIRTRFSPFPIHARMFSSTLEEPYNAETVISESLYKSLVYNAEAYSPTTSPFGYIGSTRNAQTGSPTNYNFSLWGFGDTSTPPVSSKMPFLIHASYKDAEYSWFGNEGTGVKFLNWNPYADKELANANPVQRVGYSRFDATSSSLEDVANSN